MRTIYKGSSRRLILLNSKNESIMNINKKHAAIMAGAAIITSLALVAPAFAQTNAPGNSGNAPQGSGQWQGRTGGMGGTMHGTPPAAMGTVTAINGTTLTVSGHAFAPRTTNTTGTPPTTPPAAVTYTVDASSATVKKNNATSTLSAIAVGDMVVVQGTANGTNITATSIRDGVMMHAPGTPGVAGAPGSGANAPSPIQGNGEPVVAGTVASVVGNTITVSTKSNVTYTVDATSAKVVQGQNTISLSNVATGDSVIIQGTVNGTNITASSVIDQKAPSSTGTAGSAGAPQSHGFFGSIGQFFSHLFGF